MMIIFMIKENTIALLATGDEIRNGDILNTNSQEIASRLFNHGIRLGMHMVTGDSVFEIESAIRFLLQSHRGLIITGGLGPTSDDLTRYALSNVLQKELVFDEPTWNDIVSRLKNIGYHSPPESNRQQALFPKNAAIIANPNGTAAGCMSTQDDQLIFMLPGPPIECLPMLDHDVIPYLTQHGFHKTLFHQKWLLLGVSEGQIAEVLDEIAKPFQCTTGYRICYPYIEFKIYSENAEDFAALVPRIDKAVTPYIIGEGRQTASAVLKQKLTTLPFSIHICDLATGGLLESTIKTPQTKAHLAFTYSNEIPQTGLSVLIQGLNEFWNESASKKTHLEIVMNQNNRLIEFKQELALRPTRVKPFAVELICKELCQFIQKS